MFSKYIKGFFLAAIIFFAATASAQTSPEQTAVVSQSQKTIKLKVTGITCSGDCKDIQNEVEKLNGIVSSKLVGKPSATSVFTVTYDPALVSETEIRKRVEATPGCDDPNDRPYKVKKG